MVEIATDKRSFTASYDEDRNAFTLGKLYEQARLVWPGIMFDEIAVHPSSFTHYQGDDIDQQMTVEPTEAYWRRVQ